MQRAASSDGSAEAIKQHHLQQTLQQQQQHFNGPSSYYGPPPPQNGYTASQTLAATGAPYAINGQGFARFSPYSAPAQQMYFAPHPPVGPGFSNSPSGSSPGQPIYTPEMQAMMHAALQQQHQHFQSQLAAMAAAAQQDPRRRAPSLPNSHNHAYHAQQQQQLKQQQPSNMPLQPQMYPLQPQAQPFRPASPGPQSLFSGSQLQHQPFQHHGQSASVSGPMKAHLQPVRECAATTSASPTVQDSHQAPQPPFAGPQRAASPTGRPSAEQGGSYLLSLQCLACALFD